ncbi:NADP-dependent oxidoreductase [Streptomyces sp. NBC_00249]|uniref:NADP-dependent oxidoreductase n=1 Tax=Streptomyces sp. NBC_00249 TaxID=2975690 RepID=UPI00224CCB78|nr:NADP-dependent oxidoreductase [Streptomyces sp. NBC_00249]MCX5199244.1 NADP-dependent oxidoreductase [Streptomyces sp. NBC_00249]
MGTTTETMRAVRVHAFGGPEQLLYEEVPRPAAGAGEVLVRVHAAGVNPPDRYARQGFTNIPEAMRPAWPLPFTPGTDISGVVAALGAGVTGWRVGDEVFGLVDFPGGRASAYAEYVVSPAAHLARKPAALGHVEAAAVPMAGLTAYQFVFEHLRLGDAQGATVLVNGAGGGVGHFAVQLARAAGAAQVVAVASGRHERFLEDLGADRFVDYTRTAVEDAVREEVDVLIDAVGGPDAHRLLPALRRGGHLAPVFLGDYAPHRAAALGITVAGWQVRSNGAHLTELARLADTGRLRVGIDTVFPLHEASDAHLHAERGHLQGKIVLQVAQAPYPDR